DERVADEVHVVRRAELDERVGRAEAPFGVIRANLAPLHAILGRQRRELSFEDVDLALVLPLERERADGRTDMEDALECGAEPPGRLCDGAAPREPERRDTGRT